MIAMRQVFRQKHNLRATDLIRTSKNKETPCIEIITLMNSLHTAAWLCLSTFLKEPQRPIMEKKQ